jgi:YHS domain-containing protein
MKKISLSVFAFLVAASVYAQKSDVYINDGVAANGYDVISYFSDGKPVKGNNQFAFNWNNATWYFSSKSHLDSFKINPGKYAPQFGGYCAYGVSENHKAPTSPDAWTIVNGKLYLNYNADVRGMWRKDIDNRINVANKNWPSLKGKG